MMFHFQINFIEGLNGSEKLGDTPIEGIPLYSSLDILINCLRGNFAKTLIIINDAENPFLDSSEFDPSGLLLESEKEKRKKRKEDFFWPCSQNNEHLIRGVPTGEQKEITDAQFQILCDAITNSSNLNTLSLTLNISLTEYQEQELVAAISKNRSIKKVLVVGCISSAALDAMHSITQQRPDLDIWSEFTVTSTKNIREAIQQGQDAIWRERLKGEVTQQSQAPITMHLLEGFIAVLGVAAVATAFVLLNAAALNPLGVTLVVAGGLALAGSAYAFFSSGSSEPPKKMELSHPVTPCLDLLF